MTIKEIIDKERWNLSMKNGWFEASHNDSLDRIEDAVMEHITELKSENNFVFHRVLTGMWKRIDELEKQVETAYKEGYDAGFTM